MKKVILATNNAGKIADIKATLNFPDWEFVTQAEAGIFDDPIEDADTYEGNARIKAKAIREKAQGAAVLADDSGLCVDALNGGPGVYSARYSGYHAPAEENNAKLLEELKNVPENKRQAQFVCCLVFIDEDGTETVATGKCEGHIADAPRGDNGFGYDPLFIPDAFKDGRTVSQATLEEKNDISHRGAALRNLKKLLQDR